MTPEILLSLLAGLGFDGYITDHGTHLYAHSKDVAPGCFGHSLATICYGRESGYLRVNAPGLNYEIKVNG